MRCNDWWLSIHLRYDENFRFQVFYHLVGLLKIQRRLNWTVHDLHTEWMIRCQCLRKRKIGFGEYDCVVWVRSIELYKMDDVTKPKTWMAAEYDARLKRDLNFNYSFSDFRCILT